MKFVETIKEIRLFMAVIVTLSGASVWHWDEVIEYIYLYNIHLALITAIGIYVNHFLSNTRYKMVEKKMSQQQVQITNLVLDSAKGQVRAEIRQAFKDYHEIKEIDFETTIRYLKALDERRIELGINSYSEDMMSILLNKIKL